MDQIIKNGDIWLVNFEPSRKGELGKRDRPSIVIQSNPACRRLDTVTIVPLTSQIKQSDEIYILLKPATLNGLKKTSTALCSHIYTLHKQRFIKKIGLLTEQEINSIMMGIKFHLGIAWE